MVSLTAAPVRRLRLFPESLPLLCVILIIAGSLTTAGAQTGGVDPDPGDPGTGGRNSIQGTVFYPGGRRLDRRVKVKLSSIGAGDHVTMTDDNGAFMFRRLRGGTYQITLDAGKEYEPAHETVDIIEPVRRSRSLQGQVYTVQIILQPRESPRNPAGTVNAKSATVPEDAIRLYKEALDAAQAGENKQAVEKLQNALALYPEFMLAYNELGVQYLRLNQTDKAIEAFHAALKLEPEAFVPRLNYGVALLQKKNYADAATELQQAVQKDGSSASARLHLGKALVYLGGYDRAEKELQQAIKLGDTEVVEAHRYLGVVYIEKRENARAAAALEKYLSLAPKAKDASKIRELIKQLRAQETVKRN